MFGNRSIPQSVRPGMRNITYQGADDESRTDELGPVVPRTFPPASGWSADGHRIKAHMDYCRGPELDFVHFLRLFSPICSRVRWTISSPGQPKHSTLIIHYLQAGEEERQHEQYLDTSSQFLCSAKQRVRL